jgi:phosphoglycolate phosphatase
MKPLVLFDIDGTLLAKVAEIHLDAFNYGVEKAYGIKADSRKIPTTGLVDKEILFILTKDQISKETFLDGLEKCEDAMFEFFKSKLQKEDIVVREGVRELLEEMTKRGVLIGLLTGNLERIARAKMDIVGLNNYFKVGGFGDHKDNREEVAKMALESAGDGIDKVFTVGDTPSDINAGKLIGATTIGIVTENYSEEQLKAVGADFVLHDLKDTKKFLEIIGVNG